MVAFILASFFTQANSSLIIVDNESDMATFRGEWPFSSAINYHNLGSRYAQSGGTLNAFTFTATLFTDGLYRVAVWNPTHASRLSRVAHFITHANGQTRVDVDQLTLQNQWVDLGVFYFSGLGIVEISDIDSEAGSFIGADAVRFTYQGEEMGFPVAVIDCLGVLSSGFVSVGEEVHCDGSKSFDLDGTINSYEWDFGNGSLSKGSFSSTSYLEPGRFNVRLSVEDNLGLRHVAEFVIEVMMVPQVSDIIIDDTDVSPQGSHVSMLGSWIPSSATGSYNLGSKYANSSGERDAIRFIPDISVAGIYDIDVWHPVHYSRSSSVSHVISSRDGNQTVLRDQQAFQNQWVNLGRYSLGIGTQSYVEVSDDGLNSGVFVGADAVRFRYVFENDPECAPNCTVSGDVIRISEISSKNSFYDDSDGKSPDWFELHNISTEPVNLEGWAISDDESHPGKWVFPDFIIGPGAYVPIWASGNDRHEVGFYRSLVTQGDLFSYLSPSSNVHLASNNGSDWTRLDYDDSSWPRGRSGLGYGDSDDHTLISENAISVFSRIIFTVDDVSKIEGLWLDIDYDDGFVAYINGVEVSRQNLSGDRPNFNTLADDWHEALMYQGLPPERFDLSQFIALLNNGDNVLSIQVHNLSVNSTDLTLIPFLTARYRTQSKDGVAPPELLQFADYTMHTNFEISTGDETLYLFDPQGNLHHHFDVLSMVTDKSIGLSEIDNRVTYFDQPTPGYENDLDEYQGITLNDVIFSHEGGIFNDSQVSLSGAADDEHIRYTLDATIPTKTSKKYTSAIPIHTNTVIRARVFKDGFIPSRTFSRTFIPGATHELPVVTLITDPINFFGLHSGIYAYGGDYEEANPHFGSNFWQDWETDIHFSFYEPEGALGVAFDAGVKVFGGWSRAFEHRSLSIFARGVYGFKQIQHPIFPKLNYETFQTLVLRNSGNDWMRGMMRDITLTSLMDESGVDIQAYRSSAVYLNGEYWGMYHIREKINEHFLASKHAVDIDTLDILEDENQTIRGDREEYDRLVSFIEDADLSVEESYNYVAEAIDIDNFIKYQVAQIYFDNEDWPGNNIKIWKSPQTKWRWILFDTDFGFGSNNAPRDTLSNALSDNYSSWANPPWSTLFLRRLIENDSFKYRFINQFCDYFNTRFSPNTVIEHIENVALSIEAEQLNQLQRWQDFMVINSWREEVDFIKEFGRTRVAHLEGHIENYFGLQGKSLLTVGINDVNGGYVQLNSLALDASSWQGHYYNSVPIALSAIASQGYVFSHWEGINSSRRRSISVEIEGDSSIKAIFVAAP